MGSRRTGVLGVEVVIQRNELQTTGSKGFSGNTQPKVNFLMLVLQHRID